MTDGPDLPAQAAPARRRDLVVSADGADARPLRRGRRGARRAVAVDDADAVRAAQEPGNERRSRPRRALAVRDADTPDTLSHRSAEFHPDALGVDEAPRSPIHRRVLLAFASLFAVAFAWSYFGLIASYTSAPGKIQVVDRTKVVEAVARGKVVAIKVQDGDAVEAGAVVVELDPTDTLAARDILRQKLTDLRAEIRRLETVSLAARADTVDPGARIAWADEVPNEVRQREEGVAHADLAALAAQLSTLAGQKRAKEATRDKDQASIEAQKALVAVTQENVTMIQGLTQGGFNSQARYLDMKAMLDEQQVTQTSYEGSLERAKQAIQTIDSEMGKTREAFVSAATQAISTDQQTAADLAQQLVKAEQNLSNMTLRAPVAGVVHANAVTTVAQIVKPGQQLMQIVPRDAPLEIQAYLSNQEIGFVRKGDAATIKVTAFTFGTYGSIDGTVTEVANDALSLPGKPTTQSASLDGEDRPLSTAQKTGNLQFPITVHAARSSMTVEGKEVPLVPGMDVTVEILTEKRRAIDYIVSPVLELFSTAVHER